MTDTTTLTQLISAFRSITEKDAISPETVGALLQRITDLLSSNDDIVEQNSGDITKIKEALSQLRTDLTNEANRASGEEKNIGTDATYARNAVEGFLMRLSQAVNTPGLLLYAQLGGKKNSQVTIPAASSEGTKLGLISNEDYKEFKDSAQEVEKLRVDIANTNTHVQQMILGQDEEFYNADGVLSPNKVVVFKRTQYESNEGCIAAFNRYANSLHQNAGIEYAKIPQNMIFCIVDGAPLMLFNMVRNYTDDYWVQYAFGAVRDAELRLVPGEGGKIFYRTCREGYWNPWQETAIDKNSFKTINGHSILADGTESNIVISSSDIKEGDLQQLKDETLSAALDMMGGRTKDYDSLRYPVYMKDFTLVEYMSNAGCIKAFNEFIDNLDKTGGKINDVPQNLIICQVNKKPVIVINLCRSYDTHLYVQYAIGASYNTNTDELNPDAYANNILYRTVTENETTVWTGVGLTKEDFKTINGNSIFGSGNLVIAGGGSGSTGGGTVVVEGKNYNFMAPMKAHSSDNLNVDVSIQNGGIKKEHIAEGAVTLDKLDTAVRSAIEESVNEDVIMAVIANTVAAYTFSESDFETTESVDKVSKKVSYNVTLKKGAVKTEKIADSAVTSEKIANGSVTLEKIPNGTITEDKLTEEARLSLGKIKGISLNGQVLEPNSEGIVPIAVDLPETDESLDAESTNPVQNAAIALEIAALKKNTVASIEIEPNEDSSINTLTLFNSEGGVIDSAEFAAGNGSSGGSGSDDSVSYIKVDTVLSDKQIKEGDSAVLTWSYNHLNADMEPDGVKADKVEITVVRGTTTTYSNTLNDVISGTYTLELTPSILLAGTVEVRVKAYIRNEDGSYKTKSSYKTISVITLNLTSSYSIATRVADGGYTDADTIVVPFAITGSGAKEVSMYIDGNTIPTTQTITRAGTTNGQFSIPAMGLTPGRHVIQLIAERDGLRSQSIYFDILKAGRNDIFIGTMMIFPNGMLQSGNVFIPNIPVPQYSQLNFAFIAYDPMATTAVVTEKHNGSFSNTYRVARTVQQYSNRFVEEENIAMQLRCGSLEYNINLNIEKANLNVSEAVGYKAKLSAAGRSNEETNPDIWSSGGVACSFEGFDWKSSGWTGSALRMLNGAKAEIDYRPMATDLARRGGTLEFEFRISNVTRRDANAISCFHAGKGFVITSEKASFLTGSVTDIEDEDGNITTTAAGVEMNFASDQYFKVAFVIEPRSESSLMSLYINGIRSKAYIYSAGESFVQEIPQTISIDSSYADIEIRCIRFYERALSDDECLDNYIIDRQTINEMSALVLSNDVLGEDGTVSIDKLRAKGKGVLRFVREGGLDPVNSTNDKKTDFLTDVYFYSPFGKEFDFVLRNCFMRIQGTSSTKYPRKNYRIYFAKGQSPELLVAGQSTDEKNNYIMRPGSKKNNLYTLKADYSDSSMTHNTGAAKLYDAVFREIDLLTPPQHFDATVRSAIDGFPIDVFSSETVDSESIYYGQYNFNNEKSKSGKLFGMEGVAGLDTTNAFTLECLNNTQKLCLFNVDGTGQTLQNQLAAEFDKAFEFNHPEDLFWTPAAGQSEAPERFKTALTNLFRWIAECVPADADKVLCKDIASFKSYKFKSEAALHFDLKHLLTWYVFTDYLMMVDQRAKNMMIRTWDGKIFYITYYDGDTMLGCRNDSFLAYDYTLDRETYDAAMDKYAFEGHNSWLWCLVLANFETELQEAANNLRSVLTPERTLKMFNLEQMGNWCERIYNKSGEFKYITPQTVGAVKNGEITKYNFVYALQGSREAHRTFTINNRFALLDAKYNTNAFKSDNIDAYFSRESGLPTDIIRITSIEKYFYGWGTNNVTYQSGVAAETDGTVSLTVSGAFTVNDPVRIYGASRIKKLDLTGISNRFKRELGLNKCTKMTHLVMRSDKGASTGWYLNIGSCRQLQYIDLHGQTYATTADGGTEMDLSSLTKLEHLDIGATRVQSYSLAHGAPVTTLILPESLTSLSLEYLPNLTNDGLKVESLESVTALKFASCPNLSWQDIVSRCSSLSRVRIEVGTISDDDTMLAKMLSCRGFNDDGNSIDYPALKGTWYLTKYVDDATFEQYRSVFRDLQLYQPAYSILEADCVVEDPANISNLDNRTGYKFGNRYVPSGHVSRILSERHRVLAKDHVLDNGCMYACALHDQNSNFYADRVMLAACTPAILTGAQGDFCVYEPEYWYKGVNDILNQKQFYCFHAGSEKPLEYSCTKILYDELYKKGEEGYALMLSTSLAGNSWESAVTQQTGYSYAGVRVKGFRYVRFPAVASNNIGAIFTDEEGMVIANGLTRATLAQGMLDGMYLLREIPENAVYLYFTYPNKGFDFVLLTKEEIYNSDGEPTEKIAVMEPDPVHHSACLGGVMFADASGHSYYNASIKYDSPATLQNIIHSLGEGYSAGDYEFQKDVHNLFIAKNGTRAVRIGGGNSNSAFNINNDASICSRGMTETYSADPSAPGGKSMYVDESGNEVITNFPTALGYPGLLAGPGGESWDGVQVASKIYTITSYGEKRSVNLTPVIPTSGYPSRTVHGRFMDILPVAFGGSTTTHFAENGTTEINTTTTISTIYIKVGWGNPEGLLRMKYRNMTQGGEDSNSNRTRMMFRGNIKLIPYEEFRRK